MNRLRRRVATVLFATAMAIGVMSPLAAQAAPALIPPPPATFKAECPPTIKCIVMPAPYVANSGNIEDYGNYDITNRPTDMRITSIVIHDTEGNLQDVLKLFKDPTAYKSIQYIVDQDGTVYVMVPNKDVAWHAGNWWYNSHSIGVEHVGEAADSGSYKPAIYYASSQLVRYLTGKYDIPRDRAHIVGHDNMPAVRAADVSKMHVDPGPFWNWQQYMALVGAPVLPSGSLGSGLVTVAPVWPLHKEQVTGCFPETQSCVQDGLQSVNFVYLHTEARSNAPLITDPVLGQGTTNIGNDAARLFHGQTVAVSKTQLDSGGMWYQTWVNGVQGWFYSPWKAMTAFPAKGKIVTPKADKTTIPVYGQPVPEKEEFPANVITAPSPGSFWIKPATPLPYTVGAGQRYSLGDKNVPNEYFYAWSSTGDRAQFPGDHTVYKGEQKYLQIQFGSRVAFVKAADVNVTEAK